MPTPTYDQITTRAVAIWRRAHPRASDSTITAVIAVAALFGRARRELVAESTVAAS